MSGTKEKEKGGDAEEEEDDDDGGREEGTREVRDLPRLRVNSRLIRDIVCGLKNFTTGKFSPSHS